MSPVAEAVIRSFAIRGSYPNQSRFLSSREARHRGQEGAAPKLPGYSPAIADLEIDGPQRGVIHSIQLRDLDLSLLRRAGFDTARTHLQLLLRARDGDVNAAQAVSLALEDHCRSSRERLSRVGSTECRFLVPSTSRETYPEQAISHKGSILLRLSQLGYPVPDFVILTADAYLEGERHAEVHLSRALQQLENLTCQGLGASEDPLVFAVRSATPFYVAGFMPTYLNVGVTEGTLPSLARVFGMEPAHKMFLNNLRNIYAALRRDKPDVLVSAVQPRLSSAEVERLIDRLSAEVRKMDPRLVEDPFSQAAFFLKQSYRSFEENQDVLGTLSRGAGSYPSVIIQKMVCSVSDENAHAGVLFSRHSRTGVGVQLETAHNVFGEEIMTGTMETQETTFEEHEAIRDTFPAVYHFVPHVAELEREFQSPVTIEFAVEAARNYQLFALLQLNESAMVGRAAFISVVDLHKSGVISRRRVTELICPYHIRQIESDSIDVSSFNTLDLFCSGVSVLPRGAVSARIYYAAEAALRAKRRGERVCFCKTTFEPSDTLVMREMDALISLTSAAIHVVTTCQSFGAPSLLNLGKDGVRLHQDGRLVNAAGKEIREGEWITISSRRQALYAGTARFKPARLVRYMHGEHVQLDGEEERAFAAMACAYRYYQQLIKGLQLDQISTLNEVIRLVNLEFREQADEAKELVNGWFDGHETVYVDGVLKSQLGDHLNQNTVFDMLSLDRKIRFFKRALEKCSRERISGYGAGAFMLGRFLSVAQPVGFWKAFTSSEIALLVTEWILFEQYMQLLNNMGERKLLRVRKAIMNEGLEQVLLGPPIVTCLIPLKLSRVDLNEVRDSLPSWSDRQAAAVIDLLRLPYREFYDFDAEWSVGRLKEMCLKENLPLPKPDDR